MIAQYFIYGGIMGPLCECGCGEHLPVGSTRNFKRGHKTRLELLGSPKPPVPEEDNGWTVVNPLGPEIPQAYRDAAAEAGPGDPSPAYSEAKQDKPRIHVTPRIRKDIEGKLAFWLSLPAQALMPLDPICYGAMAENAGDIAVALTPIICQSPEIVEWLTKSGNFKLWADLAMACWPVLQVMIAHHVMKTIGDKKVTGPSQNGHAQMPDISQYKAA
jgi:hypothetical protein